MESVTLGTRLRRGFNAVNQELDLEKTNQILLAVVDGINNKRAQEGWYGPTTRMYVRLNKMDDPKFPIPHTLVTIAKPGDTNDSRKLRVYEPEDLALVRRVLVSYAGDDGQNRGPTIQHQIGKIFDNARDRVHSPNPVKRFLNGFIDLSPGTF